MTSSTEWIVALDELMPVIRAQLAAGKTVTNFAPRGVSMLPMIRQGLDTVELSPVPSGGLKKFDLPLYQRDDGHYVLHRIVKVGEHYTCIGDNQFVLEYPVRHDQVIAVVTAFTRNGKRVQVTDLWHRLYCRFWHLSRPVRKVFRWLWNGTKSRVRRLFT